MEDKGSYHLQFLLTILLLHFLAPLRGDYLLRVQVHSYENPSNRCAGCGDVQGCCDNFECDDNSPPIRCDNEFLYCLRPLGTPAQTLGELINTVRDDALPGDRPGEVNCMQPPAAFRSDLNTDSVAINFTAPAFLGIPNPMEFPVNVSEWKGIQFYFDVVDRDPGTDEFIDLVALDIQPAGFPAGSGKTEFASFTGRFGFANVTLSFEVECSPGFAGESCVPVCSTDPCSNNGTCLQSVSGFTCACRGDFTGETCETRINDCQDVDCNDGTCVDGVRSFTCQCDQGFTGELCEERINTTFTGSPDSGISIGVMIGVILGVTLLLILVTILSVTLAVQKLQSPKVHQGVPHPAGLDQGILTSPNPAYANPKSARRWQGESVDDDGGYETLS